MDFHFALTSQSGPWSLEGMVGWQRAAGLKIRKPIHFRKVPGMGQEVASRN